MDILYVVVPLLLIGVVLAAVWLERWSVPVILIALGLGIVFGSDVLNVWHFDDVELFGVAQGLYRSLLAITEIEIAANADGSCAEAVNQVVTNELVGRKA